MGGVTIDYDWKPDLPSSAARTLVLVGRTGNGKSATGNSILGKKAFKSQTRSSGVTKTCELQRRVLDGQTINVIDTPGLFDSSADSEFTLKEIVRCIELAKDGIHAVLVVLSVKSRFSHEEAATLKTLMNLFGSKIRNYMIVVFTGGDMLEDDDETLEDYLGNECPESLKDFLDLCGHRQVLFDNKTKDELKRVEQVQQLLNLVNEVVAQNGGQPYSDEIFAALKRMKLHDQQEAVDALKGYSKRDIQEMKEQLNSSHKEELKRITEMVETKLKETTTGLQQQLAREQHARLEAELNAQHAQREANNEIRQLRENLKEAQNETAKLRKKVSKNNGRSGCSIM